MITEQKTEQKREFLLEIISFCIPSVGLILYVLNHKKNPFIAQQIKYAALLGAGFLLLVPNIASIYNIINLILHL